MARRRYTPKLKAQVVLEVLSGEKTPGQVAKAYGVHPNSVGALEAALRGAGAGDLRRGHGGQRVRAPDPRPGVQRHGYLTPARAREELGCRAA